MKIIRLCFRLIIYFCIFLYELIVANIQVAKLVLTPKLRFKSAAVKYSSKMKNRAELIMITNSITLTPGTLVMDADLDSKNVLVHVMSAESVNQVYEDLIQFPEQKVLWATRGEKP